MKNICDLAARRMSSHPARKAVYWWCDSVAEARRACTRQRRLWTRAKRKQLRETVSLQHQYRLAKNELRRRIKTAKARAWDNLISLVEDDPWGLPYKLVLDRLRTSSFEVASSLRPETLLALLSSLFPVTEEHPVVNRWADFEWSEDDVINVDEVVDSIRNARRRGGDPAPGPDGLPLSIWRRAPPSLLSCMTTLYNSCLREGVFPLDWKRAILILIPKAGSFVSGPTEMPKVRLICLLNEIGKIFERIIASRMKALMDSTPEMDLSDHQYGFRTRRSTCDALRFVINIIRETTENGFYAIAVSLDIQNAFNSIPWVHIRQALARRGFPNYLRRILDDYLSQRSVELRSGDGSCISFSMRAGVPQGSILGPLLWNIAFDEIPRSAAITGCNIVCYADDTLILVTGSSFFEAISRASLQARMTLRKMARLGLSVAATKTEAALFYGRRMKPSRNLSILIENRIPVKYSIKYLGILLDSRLSFKEHILKTEFKAAKVSRALSRLMPNLRGPGERKRRLFANVIASIILYGAPIWADIVSSSHVLVAILHRMQRTYALRVIGAYKTVSFDASCLLARLIPLEITARSRKRAYERILDLRANPDWSLDGENEIKRQEHELALRQWLIYLQRPGVAGIRTINAVLPSFYEWISRKWGCLGFHATQLLTGHGCFGTYLQRIGKAPNSICVFCHDKPDSSEHTLSECPAWSAERISLQLAVNYDCSLASIVEAISTRSEAWTAFTYFAGQVMRAKEAAERALEGF